MESVFEGFFKHRDSLIEQYSEGRMSKREFLEANFKSVQSSGMQPFPKVDSYEKGMYNYQYYNVLAKYYNMLSQEIEEGNDFFEKYNDYIDKTNFYYGEKDKSTLQLLKHLKFKGIEGYFVSAESKFLNNKLYEIVLRDYEYSILHSKNTGILRVLREENVFKEKKRKSLIDGYINEKY